MKRVYNMNSKYLLDSLNILNLKLYYTPKEIMNYINNSKVILGNPPYNNKKDK
jgi:hypothetical protein